MDAVDEGIHLEVGDGVTIFTERTLAGERLVVVITYEPVAKHF